MCSFLHLGAYQLTFGNYGQRLSLKSHNIYYL